MPCGSTARNRVWLSPAIPLRSTFSAEAPSATDTNTERVWLRSTEPLELTVYEDFAGSAAATTVTGTSLSTPGVAGSSTRSSAECAPVEPVRARTVTVVALPLPSSTTGGALNVPSLPSHDSSATPLPEPVRVSRTSYSLVRVVVWPPSSGAQRLYTPVPDFGVASIPASAPHTGASTVYDVGSAPLASSFHAFGTLMSPAPCAYAGWSARNVAELVSAERSAAGVTFVPERRAADRSSATSPAACGDAIDVPLNMPYPAGSS